MNRHRKATYMMRSEILKQADISKRIKIFIHSEAKDVASSPQASNEDYETFVKEVFPLSEPALDKLFDQPAEKFEPELVKAADKLYDEQESRFTTEIMRKVERDAYLQILDNFWMQHLENMEHLREGIHWMGVGQKDPLVEYRKQSQVIFEDMQLAMRHDVVRALFHARPLEPSEVNRSVETELTRAARGSVDNADKIIEGESIQETDFSSQKQQNIELRKSHNKLKKTRKAERQRKKKSKKRK